MRLRGGRADSWWRAAISMAAPPPAFPSSAPASAAVECDRASPPRHRSHRSDERPFHDPARRLRAAGAVALLARLQDSARHSGDGAGQPAHVELPSSFHERHHGESKLDSKIALDFAALVTAKLTNDAVSARFLLFCLVGLTGLVVHLIVLSALLRGRSSFGAAQALATVGAITWNFVLNNLFTYRDQRLTGWRFRHRPPPLPGDLRHRRHLQCRHRHLDLRLRRGLVARRLGGALIGTVWNFVVSAAFVWRQR